MAYGKGPELDHMRMMGIKTGILPLVFGISALLVVGPSLGWLSGIAIACGAIAYALMAINIFLALRRPIVESIVGPLDRVYSLHRLIGILIMGIAGAHAILIALAMMVDRGVSLFGIMVPTLSLGMIGLLLVVASVILALNTRISYDRWQRIHIATGGAFLVLTVHVWGGLNTWAASNVVMLVIFFFLGALGIGSLIVRVLDKFRKGIPYVVEETRKRHRAIEIRMRPKGSRSFVHKAGQFAFLTATVAGARETHPFTLTGVAGNADRHSMLIRDAGDWTSLAQNGIRKGDVVYLTGPFGGFIPDAIPKDRHQVWIAGGSGITPFLSTIRSWDDSRVAPVQLLFAARSQQDAPAWEELATAAERLPWLHLTPIFSEVGKRIDADTITELVEGAGPDAVWFMCGPTSLMHTVRHQLMTMGQDRGDVYEERYYWRGSATP